MVKLPFAVKKFRILRSPLTLIFAYGPLGRSTSWPAMVVITAEVVLIARTNDPLNWKPPLLKPVPALNVIFAASPLLLMSSAPFALSDRSVTFASLGLTVAVAP